MSRRRLYKIYFTRLHKETEIVKNVTFIYAESIKQATKYGLETFGDNLLEVVQK
tara:strand:+ start:61 stop:222 length:162 start_codon:yes stop_codon:yes gene_type:complete